MIIPAQLSYNLTENLTAQYAHNLCAALPNKRKAWYSL